MSTEKTSVQKADGTVIPSKSKKKQTSAHVVAFVLCELLERDKIGITEVCNSLDLSRPRVVGVLSGMVKARLLRRTNFLNDKKVSEYAFCKGSHPVFKLPV